MINWGYNIGLEVPYCNLLQMVDIYCEGFSCYPWCETWIDTDAEDYLRGLLANSTYLITLDKESNVVGFAFGMLLSSYKDNADLISLGASKNDFYISDIVVSQKVRRQNVGLSMMRILDCMTHSRGFLFRTHVQNTPMYRIANHLKMGKIGTVFAETGGQKSERIVFRRS